jgi:hypothetical protein
MCEAERLVPQLAVHYRSIPCLPSFEIGIKEVTGGIAQEPSGGDRLADRIV